MMARLRFIILQVVMASVLVAAWMAGPLQLVFAGEARYFVFGVLALGAVGLGLTSFGRTKDAERLQDILPVIAVCAMQVGILSALAVMAQALMSSGDPSKAVGGFFAALSAALYVSVSALASYLWLRITLWLAHGE